MSMLPDAIRNPLAFVVVLGILVFVHEMGHYLAARWRGVHIETFSIGFGRAIYAWTDRVGTVWKLAWIPLGGYVKLHGQERPEDVPDEVRAGWIAGRTFHEKSVLSRAIVVAAGPIANLLLAAVVFALLFAISGRPVAVEAPTIGAIVADGAAGKAGLQPGDRVLSIDGMAVCKFADLQRIIGANPERTLALRYERGSEQRSADVTTGWRDGGQGRRIGVLGVSSATEIQHLGPLQAVWAGVQQTGEVVTETLAGLWQMIRGGRGADQLSGPLGIMQLSGQVAQLGMAKLAGFIALLSVNLALINLFPIPVLDGGHLVFYFCEWVRGRPLSARVQEYGFRAGFALLACLFVFATWNDLSHFGLFRWVTGLMGQG